MKKLNLLAGLIVLTFLVASALPAYSAKGGNSGNSGKGQDWPDGKDFDSWEGALEIGTPCVFPSPDGQSADELYKDAEYSVSQLIFEVSGNLKQQGPYPMPDLDVYGGGDIETNAKDEASAAWDLYNSKFDYSKGKDVRSKIGSVLSKFENNTTEEEGVRVGGRWTDSDPDDEEPTLDDIHTTFTNLYLCVGGTLDE